MDTDNTIKVYVQTDAIGSITAVNSSIFLQDTTDWTEIDSGTGDRCAHAQGNYFDRPIVTAEGIYRYKLAEGAVTEKTPEEISAEAAALPTPKPAEIEILKAQLKAQTERNDFVEDCIAEMAMQVYQ